MKFEQLYTLVGVTSEAPNHERSGDDYNLTLLFLSHQAFCLNLPHNPHDFLQKFAYLCSAVLVHLPSLENS